MSTALWCPVGPEYRKKKHLDRAECFSFDINSKITVEIITHFLNRYENKIQVRYEFQIVLINFELIIENQNVR